MTFTVRTAKIYTLTFNYIKDTFISCGKHTTLQADNRMLSKTCQQTKVRHFDQRRFGLAKELFLRGHTWYYLITHEVS